MKIFLVLSTFLLLVSCKSDTEIAASHQWKYMEGFRIRDWMVFNGDKDRGEGLYLLHDTIYIEKAPIGLIIGCNYNVDHYVLKIGSLDGKQKGMYTEKGDAKPTE